MKAVSLLHHVIRWLVILIGAGAWVWLIALLLALLGWTVWAAHHLLVRIGRSAVASGRRVRLAGPRASGQGLTGHRQAAAAPPPKLRILPRPRA